MWTQSIQIMALPLTVLIAMNRYSRKINLAIAAFLFCFGCKNINYPAGAPRIASDFLSDKHVDGQSRNVLHQGIDILVEDIKFVLAVADGKILKSGEEKCWGLTIAADHGLGIDGQKIVAIYSHLSEIIVNDGERVKRGQPIARLDKNNRNYECINGIKSHLHFQIGREFNALYLHKPNWGWRYSLYDIDRGINPHLYWANGKNNITCFDKNKKYKRGTITYPVPC